MAITVKRELYTPRSGRAAAESRGMKYLSPTGLKREEYRALGSQSDTTDFIEYRHSEDNGRTWGEWFRRQKATKIDIGPDQYEGGNVPPDVWNPVHGHYVSLRYQRLYLGGYEAATEKYWAGDGSDMIDHTFMDIKDVNGNVLSSKLVMYEDGASDFNEATYRTEAYTSRNRGIGDSLIVMANGEILFTVNVPFAEYARVFGINVSEVCPSIPRNSGTTVICRAKWNAETQRYDVIHTSHIHIDDRQGSRGTMENTIAELKSGKILLVFRISNIATEKWNTRISPYAPNYKMFCLSDDGGKTFSPPMPWHFDTREVVYSSSTYSVLLRSEANGRLYWIGNVTEASKNNGNWPRYPLHIAEVDEEWGCIKKDTLTEIETRREGETERIQLSNFQIIQDRESTNLELYLVKIGQFPNASIWDSESWKYTITLPE